VQMKWKTPGKRFSDADLTSDYTMQLEFGKRQGRKIAARVYLAMQDPAKSFVVGTFWCEIE
jgi:hypothetical protein